MSKNSFNGRKPHGLKKILKKVFFYFSNDRLKELCYYLITETVNNIPIWILKFSEKKICPICGYEAHNFYHLSNNTEVTWNSACPKCDSRSRHRGLFFIYKKYIKNNNKKKILHFAPEPILLPLFKGKNLSYFTTDLNMENVSYPNEDIQDLSFDNDSFDLILCNHVLEHVPNDEKALEEIARVLTKNGIAIITVPGNIKNKKTLSQNPYNNNGHFRYYGADIKNRMEKFFNEVNVINMYNNSEDLYAIKKVEVAYICEK